MRCEVDEMRERLENELCYDYDYELCSFSNRSVALSTSRLILQLLRCFTYVTAHSPTLLLFLLRHRIFTYVTWRAAHGDMNSKDEDKIGSHSTVERTTIHHCLFHRNVGGGSTNAVNIIIERERVNTFSVSLQNFVSSCFL